MLAFMVNGAQGDDDEAHAGHFALVTGRTQEDGAIGDWLVNNFYALDSESEKGILAAPGSARQLSRRSQQRAGMVSAVADARPRARRRSRRGARPGGVESGLQPVLAAPAPLPARVDELHRHQRRRAARAGVGHSRARSGGQDRGGARISVCRGEGALRRQGARRLRLSDRGPDAAPAGRRFRGMRRGGAAS